MKRRQETDSDHRAEQAGLEASRRRVDYARVIRACLGRDAHSAETQPAEEEDRGEDEETENPHLGCRLEVCIVCHVLQRRVGVAIEMDHGLVVADADAGQEVLLEHLEARPEQRRPDIRRLLIELHRGEETGERRSRRSVEERSGKKAPQREIAQGTLRVKDGGREARDEAEEAAA